MSCRSADPTARAGVALEGSSLLAPGRARGLQAGAPRSPPAAAGAVASCWAAPAPTAPTAQSQQCSCTQLPSWLELRGPGKRSSWVSGLRPAPLPAPASLRGRGPSVQSCSAAQLIWSFVVGDSPEQPGPSVRTGRRGRETQQRQRLDSAERDLLGARVRPRDRRVALAAGEGSVL